MPPDCLGRRVGRPPLRISKDISRCRPDDNIGAILTWLVGISDEARTDPAAHLIGSREDHARPLIGRRGRVGIEILGSRAHEPPGPLHILSGGTIKSALNSGSGRSIPRSRDVEDPAGRQCIGRGIVEEIARLEDWELHHPDVRGKTPAPASSTLPTGPKCPIGWPRRSPNRPRPSL